MAENEKAKNENREHKIENTNTPHHRGNRPHYRGNRPHHGKPKPRDDKKEAASNEAVAEKKPRPAHRKEEQKAKPHKPAHHHKEKAPQNEAPAKRTENRRAIVIEEHKTAEQKAFAEAKDIMYEAAENRKNGIVIEEDDSPKVEIVGVRFKPSGKIYYFAPKDISFEAGDGVIVETARGQEYGLVALSNRMVKEKDTVQPLKEVIRKATEQDGVKHAQNKELEKKAEKIWTELVEKHKLEMNLTEVEYTFDNSKLIFYFTADGRVDFRELVKDLASVFRTRIELRQIGVRDEAKLLGGIGVCGMPFCCNRFLPDFVQVSIKMAKEQNLSLSSSKISGNCGRLMCCLRYEQDVYEMEYETFPRVDMVVRTEIGTGVVAESNFINGKIKVRMDGDGTAVYKVFTRDEVKVIGKAKSHRDDALEKELKALED